MMGVLAGLGVVEPMKGAGCPFFAGVVVQAESDERAAAARQAKMSFFIIAQLVLIGFLPIYAQENDCVSAVVFCDFGDGRILVLLEES
jgi:hypothetical protein